MTVAELNEKKLIALLPFKLLKLRKKIENLRTEENLKELQTLVIDDIINSIDTNVEAGNISSTEAFDLKALTTLLYMKIYSKYKELEDFTMRLYDQSLELPSDKYEKTVEELEEENNQLKADIIALKNELNSTKDIINNLQEQLSSL